MTFPQNPRKVGKSYHVYIIREKDWQMTAQMTAITDLKWSPREIKSSRSMSIKSWRSCPLSSLPSSAVTPNISTWSVKTNNTGNTTKSAQIWINYLHIIITIINPLTARVVGAPQMILQPVFSIFPCSPLPSGTWQTPGLSIPWCCLPTSSSVST